MNTWKINYGILTLSLTQATESTKKIKMKTSPIILIVVIIFLSCSKNKDTDSTIIPKEDSLSAGWSKVKVGTENISDIYFITNDIGYLVSLKNCYKSTDGGRNWIRSLDSAYGYFLTATADGKVFIPNNNGIYQSNDFGATFSNNRISGIDMFSDVCFTGKDSGYIATYPRNNLLRTFDGGITWNKTSPINGLNLSTNPTTLFFINSSTGWISDGQSVFKTTGSLNNWVRCTSDIDNQTKEYISIFATSPDIVYLGTLSRIYKSTNGGTNFNLIIKVPEESNYTDICFVDKDNGYFNTNESIYKTTNGGTTWKKVVSLKENKITEIHFTDANHGWACGIDGTVLIFKQ